MTCRPSAPAAPAARGGGARRTGSLSPVPRLSEVIAELDALWPPERAEGWDAVGTVCGEPGAPRSTGSSSPSTPSRRSPTRPARLGAQLIVTHHPLYLRGTTTVAASTFKGRVVHTLIKHDIALHVAHTNADTADPGVSDALAGALDLRVTGPLVPDPTDPAGRRGLGRICELDHPDDPRATSPPAPPPGCPPPRRASGWPATRTPLVRTVAVSGGSGDSLFDAVRAAGVDAFLTADLRHHPASEAVQHSPLGAASTPRTGPPNGPGASRPPPSSTRFPTATAGTCGSTSRSTVTDPWTTHHSSGAPN